MAPATFGWFVLLCPLAGSVLIGLLHMRLPGRSAGYLGTLAIALAFACSLGALITLLGKPPEHREVTSSLWNYASTIGLDAKLQVLVDPLSVFMILVVTGVSTLIHLYSVAYMKGDQGFNRYFAYLNFFVFSMLLLILGGNFILLITGWAFVGAASYLLISFWYRRTTATRAGLKAFVINVFGDVGLVIGTFLLLRQTGTVDFLKTFAVAPHVFHHTNDGTLVAACLMLLIGAFAKSAQVPLHTWLPDAMEGPTPVSALIHAATMVTAGVYLIARMHPLFELAPTAADVGAIGGCLTLLVAATIAFVVTDLKRVIAYSTMSQIGYMIMGVSLGAYSAGLFHLMTHAFFKALLFMSAGSVIGAMAGDQSLDRMSGFRKAMPFTFGCFIVGGLALSGVPPFSGWLSKDEIVGYALHRGGGYAVLGIIGLLGALMTALYTFRMIFRTFYGPACEEARLLEGGHLAHAETPRNPVTGEEEDTDVGFPGPEHVVAEGSIHMKIAMGILALLAAVAGLAQIPGVDHVVRTFLDPAFAGSKLAASDPSTGSSWLGLVAGALLGILGIALAYRIWVVKRGSAAAIQTRFSGVHSFLSQAWYFNELIDLVIVRPALALGRFADTVVERFVISGAITDGTSGVVRASSAFVRRAQTGLVRLYAAFVVGGVAVVALYFLVSASF